MNSSRTNVEGNWGASYSINGCEPIDLDSIGTSRKRVFTGQINPSMTILSPEAQRNVLLIKLGIALFVTADVALAVIFFSSVL